MEYLELPVDKIMDNYPSIQRFIGNVQVFVDMNPHPAEMGKNQ